MFCRRCRKIIPRIIDYRGELFCEHCGQVNDFSELEILASLPFFIIGQALTRPPEARR